jgi:hypothetical protein
MPGTDASAVLKRFLILAESSAGAGLTASGYKELQSLKFTMAPKPSFSSAKGSGQLFETVALPNNETTTLTGEGVGTYTEIIYPYAGAFKSVTVTTPAGATLARRWTYTISQATEDTPQTFAILSGTTVRSENANYGLFSGIQHEFTRNDGLKLSGLTGLGRRIRDNLAQWLTISGTPTGGTFDVISTLTDSTAKPTVTTAIAYNASTAAVQTALQALATIGSGGAIVTGSAGAWVVTFSGTETTFRLQAVLELYDNQLTGGTAPTVGIVHTTSGASPATNDVQTLTTSGTPTGGTFRLRLASCRTAPIAYNASAATVQTAVLAIPCFASGDITFSGSALPSNTQFVQMAGTYLTNPAPALTVLGTALTGGTSPAGAFSPLPPAANISTLALVPILGNQFDWYYGRTQADAALTVNKFNRIFNVKWGIGARWDVFAGMDTTVDGFSGYVTDQLTAPVSFIVGADDAGEQFYSSARIGEKVFIRGYAAGATIETGFTYYYEVTICLIIDDVKEMKAEQKLLAREYSGKIAYDSTWGQAVQVVVQNAITAL